MTHHSLVYDKETVLIGVCGLHMRGYPLEAQLLAHGAHFVCEDKTMPDYRLYKLPTEPPKPGLIRVNGGVSIALEIWEMPVERFGSFTALIPTPLGIGKIQVQSGRDVCGFICEGYVVDTAEDISAYGGWRSIFPPKNT